MPIKCHRGMSSKRNPSLSSHTVHRSERVVLKTLHSFPFLFSFYSYSIFFFSTFLWIEIFLFFSAFCRRLIESFATPPFLEKSHIPRVITNFKKQISTCFFISLFRQISTSLLLFSLILHLLAHMMIIFFSYHHIRTLRSSQA